MASSSPSPADRARKGVALVLQAMQAPGTAQALACSMGLSEATVSRIKNERIEEVALLCAHLGIKWVHANSTCVSPETYAFLTTTHARVMAKAPELIWESESE